MTVAFNGSGLFNIDSTGQPVSANTLIESADFNALTADLATGLSNCITKDGQQTVTANLPMATYRHTGVGNAVARTDYAAAGQVQDGKLNWVDGGGTADAITATYSPAITALVDGQMCCVRATAANATTTPTFSPNGLTARTIVKKGGAALVAGDIVADGHELILRYDLANTRWELLNPAPASLAANTFTGLQQLNADNIASGATVDLGTATGNTVTVTHSTGTTAITSLGGASLQAGTEIETIFSISGGTLTITHHATNLYLAGGANITLANGDVIRWRKMHSSNAEWKMVGGWRADGSSWAVPPSQAEAEAGTATTPRPWTAERVAQAIAALGASGSATFGTVVDTSTGATSYTVTGLPSGVKKIAFAYGGISTNGTASVQIRVGPSGGVVNSGYAGAVYDGTTATLKTDGFYIDDFGAAAVVRHGRGDMQLIDASTNTWSWDTKTLSSDSNRAMRSGAGTISLAGALERFQIIANGTDTFDAGKLNILYWT